MRARLPTSAPLTLLVVAALPALPACGGHVGNTISAPARLAGADEGYQLIQEPDEGLSPVVGLVSHAARTARLTMYELNDPAAVNALIDAHHRGVDTKVILDTAFRGRDTNAAAFEQLHDGGVDVRWAPADVIYHQLSGGLTLEAC